MERLSRRFPINRRHQGLATVLVAAWGADASQYGFQSIGVTKDWRQRTGARVYSRLQLSFQSIGVTKDWRLSCITCYILYPLSFQSIGVTKDWRRLPPAALRPPASPFPINRRHLGLATPHPSLRAVDAGRLFPINRRHQGLATLKLLRHCQG